MAAPHPGFPAQDPSVVFEMVQVCHFDTDRVRALLDVSPALANATVDWGFGDWETALGAAAHVGNREIANLLLERGARPTLFASAMLGWTDLVRSFVERRPGIQGTLGPHGITLLAHARAGGDDARAVVQYLERVGGADPQLEATPLPSDRFSIYLGSYAYGDGEQDVMIVEERNDRLRILAAGGIPRPLYLKAADTFFPMGAPAMDIAFEVTGGRARSLTIADAGGDPWIRAERMDA